MPDNIFVQLKKLLKGPIGVKRVPSNISHSQAQKSVFSGFARAAYSMYQASLAATGERYNRYNDFELMEQTPEIATALNVIADDCTTKGEDGKVLNIQAPNKKIRQELRDLFAQL